MGYAVEQTDFAGKTHDRIEDFLIYVRCFIFIGAGEIHPDEEIIQQPWAVWAVLRLFAFVFDG